MDPLLTLSDDRIAWEQRRAQEAKAEARRWGWTVARAMFTAVAGTLLGLLLLALSVHARDPDVGAALFWGALCVGNGGLFYGTLWLWAREEL